VHHKLVCSQYARVSQGTAQCVTDYCSLGLRDEVSARGVRRCGNPLVTGTLQESLQGDGCATAGSGRRNRSHPSIDRISAEAFGIRAGERAQGHVESLTPSVTPRYRREILARRAVVTVLFCSERGRSAAGDHQAVRRGSAHSQNAVVAGPLYLPAMNGGVSRGF